MDYGLLKKYTQDINVLYIEDDIDLRKELSELLLDIFPNVHTACDGEDGLNKYLQYKDTHKKHYELIISDIKMPKLNGVELIERIYKINPEQNIVVLSARNEFDFLLPLINLGIQHFFPKPIIFKDFLDEIYTISYKIYKIKEEEKNDKFIQISENIFWNKENKELIKNSQKEKITKTEVLLLNKLTQDNARVFTIEELFILLWGNCADERATKDNLKNIISRLRKKIPEIEIKSVYAMGYKLEIKD